MGVMPKRLLNYASRLAKKQGQPMVLRSQTELGSD